MYASSVLQRFGLFDLILYVPVNKLRRDGSSWDEPVLS